MQSAQSNIRRVSSSAATFSAVSAETFASSLSTSLFRPVSPASETQLSATTISPATRLSTRTYNTENVGQLTKCETTETKTLTAP